MPDQQSPISFIQNSLAAGEVSPSLIGRMDLARVHQSALTMKNWFVDCRGGASTRPGTQYIGQPGSTGYARLRAFKFSATLGQTYILVFSNLKLRFIKNPGGNCYPNSSNSGLILSGGVPYEIATPYLEADLRSLKFSQIGDELTITRLGYARRKLVRLSDTNWTLSTIGTNVSIASPVITNATISALPAGSTDPQKTRYSYVVTAVDADGNESQPSAPYIAGPGIDIGATQGTVSIFFTAIAGAAYYKVYKALPTPGDKWPNTSDERGFAGFSYGTVFLDSNIVADFSRSPPSNGDPFEPGQVTGFTISASSADWPVGGTSVTLAGGGSPTRPAVIYPILDNNAPAGTGNIVSLYIADPGAGYSSAPTVTAVGAGGTTFTATLTLGPTTGLDPDVVGLFQQRQIYAATSNRPFTIFGSKPGKRDDFRRTNPTVDSDGYIFDIVDSSVNRIFWIQSMPGGLVIGTDSSIVQLTGGSASASNPLAVTPSSAVIVPQSKYGTIDLHPIVIDYDILFVNGSIVRDLQYNFFVNIYTGTDISAFSNHLFYPLSLVDWAYQDSPNKVIWCIRSDNTLLSLTWLKSQEILGWAVHDTPSGLIESVETVQEGNMDATYFSVNRNGVRFIERLCDRVYYQVDDSWCLDAALSTVATFPAAAIALSGTTGVVTVTASASVFAPGDVGKVIRAVASKGVITGYTSGTVVQLTIDPGYPFGVSQSVGSGSWRMDPVVSSVGGLTHLNGYQVLALVDGKVQGPFTVSGGSITLTTPGSSVVVGIRYVCDLQPVMFDPGGEATVQGRRKKFTAVTLRLKDAAGLKYGKTRGTVRAFVPGITSTDPQEEIVQYPGLVRGDQRVHLDQVFDVLGSMWIVQDQPLPATVLAVIPEVAQGDTR